MSRVSTLVQMVTGKTAESLLSIFSLLNAVTAKYQVPGLRLPMTWLVAPELPTVITVFIVVALVP
jgi:hypothetical protein